MVQPGTERHKEEGKQLKGH